jgi:hypothetical protein
MRFLSTTRRRVGAAVAAVAVAGGVGAFVLVSSAFASGPTPQAVTTAASSTTTHAKAKRHGLLAHSDHATLQVKRHGHWVTYGLNRGKVKAATSSDITIVRPDGVTVSIPLTSRTKYKGVSGESGLQVGKHATVISAAGSALRVRQIRPGQTRAATAASQLSSVSQG